jgi:MFS transporter, ACS family, tartrate transporter
MTPSTAPNPALAQARRKAFWRLLPMLFLSYLIAYVDRQNVAVAKLTMVQDLPDFDDKVIGFGAGVFFWGYFLLEVPGTLLVERWSARKWLARIMVTWGIMAALTAFVRTPVQFYVVRFFLGLAEAGFFPGVIVYLTHWFTRRDRAKALATFFVASPLAQIVSPLVNKWLLLIGVSAENLLKLHQTGLEPRPALWGLTGWQWIYILWGIPAVIMGLVVLCKLTDSPSEAKWLTTEQREALQAALAEEKALSPSAGHQSLWQGLANPKVWLLSLAFICAVQGSYSIEFFLPSILRDWYALDVTQLMGFIMLPPLLAMVAQPLFGWSSDRKQERRWHAAVPLAVAAISMACLPWSRGHLWLTLGLFMLAMSGLKAYMPAFWSLPHLFLANTAAAGSIGFINSFGNLGGFVGPTLTGWIKETTGSYDASLRLLSLSVCCSACLVFAIASRVQKRNGVQE